MKYAIVMAPQAKTVAAESGFISEGCGDGTSPLRGVGTG